MADPERADKSSSSSIDVAEIAPFDQPGGLGISREDEELLRADVKWKGVAKQMRLGRITVMCLIFNRMIGTGIFRTPATVFNSTENVGVSMLWWCLGAIVAMCGILVYMELGLTLPLYKFGDQVISVPRSGGELNYLKYIFKKPVYFTTCIFGIAFVLLGNVATNSIAFALSILAAAGKTDVEIENQNHVVRGIAIATVAFSCLIHGSWRQGGIYLNNLLALLKISILLMIFILGMLAQRGVFGEPKGPLHNPSGSSVFAGKSPDPYGYAESFLSILFSFGGFNQANYVMAEIDDPRRRYKWPAFSAVAIVSVLYLLANVSYFIVVPPENFRNAITGNVAHNFFELTLGKIPSQWAPEAPRMLSAFMAISSLGNIIVMTYTASRVKQEIAKEGILPFKRFLAGSLKSFNVPVRRLWGSKLESLPEEIPFGALVLHLLMSILLILFTWSLTTPTTYSVLVDLYSYTIDAIFGVCIGFGLVYMRTLSRRGWAKHSRDSGFQISPIISTIAAAVFGLANLYPVAAKWIPPKDDTSLTTPYYITGVVSWSIIGCGMIWWFSFRFIVPRVGRSHVGRYLLVTRKLWFHTENHYKVLVYEDIDFRWLSRRTEQKLEERTFYAEEDEVTNRLRADGIHM